MQIIRYAQGKRIIVRHMGSAHTDEELTALYQEVKTVREQLSPQLSFFSIIEKPTKLLHEDHLQLTKVRDILWNVQEAHIKDELIGKTITLQTNMKDFNKSKLVGFLKPH